MTRFTFTVPRAALFSIGRGDLGRTGEFTQTDVGLPQLSLRQRRAFHDGVRSGHRKQVQRQQPAQDLDNISGFNFSERRLVFLQTQAMAGAQFQTIPTPDSILQVIDRPCMSRTTQRRTVPDDGLQTNHHLSGWPQRPLRLTVAVLWQSNR